MESIICTLGVPMYRISRAFAKINIPVYASYFIATYEYKYVNFYYFLYVHCIYNNTACESEWVLNIFRISETFHNKID